MFSILETVVRALLILGPPITVSPFHMICLLAFRVSEYPFIQLFVECLFSTQGIKLFSQQ